MDRIVEVNEKVGRTADDAGELELVVALLRWSEPLSASVKQFPATLLFF